MGGHQLVHESEISLTLLELGIGPSLIRRLSWRPDRRRSRDHCRQRQYAGAKDLQDHSDCHDPSLLSRFGFQFQLLLVTLLEGRGIVETRQAPK